MNISRGLKEKSLTRKAKGHILVVEDEPRTCELLREFLSMRGFRVTEARNGEEAIEAALKVLPSAILLDLFMPIQDGYTTARQLRTIKSLRLSPIIVISAYGDMAIQFFKNIEQLGTAPIEYLPKPFDPLHLGEILDKLL